MTDWFRSWHGAPTDPKWILIARKASTTPGVASAVAWALFDHASQSRPRGSVVSFDVEFYSAWAGFEEKVVCAVVEAMTDKGMIIDGVLANWSKRQPEREDGSAERAREWRERKRTQANAHSSTATATEPHREDTEQNRTEIIPTSSGAAAPEEIVFDEAKAQDAELFDFGRRVLGKNAGGLISKLKAHFKGDIAETRRALEMARSKGTGAAAYVGRIVSGAGPPMGRPDLLAAAQEGAMLLQREKELKL